MNCENLFDLESVTQIKFLGCSLGLVTMETASGYMFPGSEHIE